MSTKYLLADGSVDYESMHVQGAIDCCEGEGFWQEAEGVEGLWREVKELRNLVMVYKPVYEAAVAAMDSELGKAIMALRRTQETEAGTK